MWVPAVVRVRAGAAVVGGVEPRVAVLAEHRGPIVAAYAHAVFRFTRRNAVVCTPSTVLNGIRTQ